MKTRINLLILFVVEFGVISHAQTRQIPKHNKQWALTKIKALPEVKDFMLHSKKNKPAIIVAGEPDSGRHDYWIKVGINNFDMFRTIYDFDVDPKTSRIYIEQIYLWLEPGSHRASLKQWREWRSDPRFNKPHIFKNGRIISIKDSTWYAKK